MRHLLPVVFAASLAACSSLTGARDMGGSSDFESDTSATDLRVREDRARAGLGKIESSLADFVKTEKKIPARLEELIPKYLAELPTLSLPTCGRDTDRVEPYGPEILRGGQVDGSRIKGTGRWGYVYNDGRVVVFVDCVKPSTRGVPWYQERGAY
ncbi:MAG: hypothetical protein SF051_11080 [Elusimicrobiota bacterium]|nr:hypothetical protein [Elusimicrobiota bacterium]